MKQEKKVKEQFKVVLNEINSPNTKKRPNTYQQPYKSDLLSAPLLNLESDPRSLSKKLSNSPKNNFRIEGEISPIHTFYKDTITGTSQTQNKWEETIEALNRKSSRHVLTQDALSPASKVSVFYTGDDIFTIENEDQKEERNLNQLQRIQFQNKRFQKNSFLELSSMFSNSSTDAPFKLYDTRKRSTEPREGNSTLEQPSTIQREMYGFKPKPKPTVIFHKKQEALDNSVEKHANHYVPVEDLIPTLVDIAQLKFHETLFIRYHSEFPKIKAIDWERIIEELQIAKLEVCVMDPIFFVIEGYYELPVNGSSIADKIQYCVRELSAFNNEAKHILIYTVNKLNEKRLFLSKFLFQIKSHHNYNKGLKNEKEVLLYYLLILGMLEFKMKYEYNPILADKLESLRSKALDMIKGNEPPAQYLIDWFTRKIEAFVNIEKMFYHQNIKGKVNSNFVFNIKEYFEKHFAIDIEGNQKNSKKSLLPRSQISPMRSTDPTGKSYSPNKIKWARLEINSHKDIKRLELIPNDVNIFSDDTRHLLKDTSKTYISKEDLDVFRTPSDLSVIDAENGATKKTINQTPVLYGSSSVGTLNIKKKLPIKIPVPIHVEFMEINLEKGTTKGNQKIVTPTALHKTSLGFFSPQQTTLANTNLNRDPRNTTSYKIRKVPFMRKGF